MADHPDCPTEILDAVMESPTVMLLTHLLSRESACDWQATRRNLRTDISHLVVDVLAAAARPGQAIDLREVPEPRPATGARSSRPV